MATKLIIDGNAVYELDEDCLECRKKNEILRGKQKKSGSHANAQGSVRTDYSGKAIIH
ncbi:MAG: hypothetical protein LIO81_11500 [Clostridiales bacterium]|nr:hypothetical protein [Clostridiales bacterium]